jgi:hypothetical protein
MRQHHVKRVDGWDADVGQQVTLVAPINLSLGARDHLEPAVQTRQRVVIRLIQLGRDPWPSLGKEHLDPLIVAGETVLGDQPLMDHGALQPQISPQPRLDDRHERGNEQRLAAGPRRTRRRDRGSILGQIPTNRAPITTALAANLGERGARSMQGAETTNVHPGLRIQDHEQGHPSVCLLGGGQPKGDPSLGTAGAQRAETDLHVRSYGERHMR